MDIEPGLWVRPCGGLLVAARVPDANIANGKDAVGSLPFITEDIL